MDITPSDTQHFGSSFARLGFKHTDLNRFEIVASLENVRDCDELQVRRADGLRLKSGEAIVETFRSGRRRRFRNATATITRREFVTKRPTCSQTSEARRVTKFTDGFRS
jgi:hypothetical protein